MKTIKTFNSIILTDAQKQRAVAAGSVVAVLTIPFFIGLPMVSAAILGGFMFIGMMSK